MNKFSVIIPTMWKSDAIFNLLDQMEICDIIGEIIIIDNDPQTKPNLFKYVKIKYYTEGKNIYVNPAWNIGVKLANNELISICNDDIIFNVNSVFDWILKNESHLGTIGIYGESFNGPVDNDGVATLKNDIESGRHIRAGHFGCLMFVKKSNWIDIPKDLKIWYGDNWITLHNKPVHVFRPKDGIRGKKHTTSSNKSFLKIIQQDKLVWSKIFTK